MIDSNELRPPTTDWTAPQRFAFRAAFVYFGLFGLASLFDGSTSPRALFASVYDPVIGWFGRSILGLAGGPNDVGVAWAIVRQVAAIVVALALTLVWSAVGRRKEYDRLHGWSRIVLRYYVAVVMLIYGGVKVINSQFPPLSLDQLSQPLGSFAPMGLLWAFMGYSTLYSSFAGFGEVIGAFLLFFRRTTTVGCLILIGVLSNVVLLNYAYDVPVKQLSTNLLIASIVLVAPDARRLFNVLIVNRPTQPANLVFALPRWLANVRRFVKPIIVVGATCIPLAISWSLQPRLRRRAELFGIYEVAEFTRNGQTIPPLLTASDRWRTVVFSRPGTMSIRLMSDSVRRLAASVDTTQHRLTFWSPRDQKDRSVLSYERLTDGGLHVRGVDRSDTLDVTLRRVDHTKAYRLLGRR